MMDQENYDPIKSLLLRNTTDYNFADKSSEYSYVKNPLETDNQRGIIDYTSTGKVDSFEIVDPGDNYQVGDKISLSLETNGEVTETVKIDSISGKEVNSVSYSTYVENEIEIVQIDSSRYIGVCTDIHNFKNLDLVKLSGFTTEVSNNLKKELFELNDTVQNYTLKTTLDSALVTGEITNAGLNGDLSFPTLMPDDILVINNEKLKVLEVDRLNNYVRVEREVDGTVGLAHSNSSVIYQDSRKVKFNLESDNIDIRSRLNRVLYIDPKTTVSIGLSHGPGIGNDLPIPNVSSGSTQVFVDTRSIYYRNHNLKTGDKLIYSSNAGDPIKISLDGSTSVDISEGQEFYAVWLSKDTVGLSTQKLLKYGSLYRSVDYSTDVSFDDALVYFSYVGTEDNHKFTTDLDDIVKLTLLEI